MNLRQRLAIGTDRLLTAALVALLAGTTVAFGGRAWWAPPAVGGVCLSVVLLGLTRALLGGSFRVLKSPLTALGVLALGLALAQLVPLPGRYSAGLSPASRAAYGQGLLPDRARALDPTVELPEAPEIRSPVSLDRPATLRWLAGASACLGVFWAVGQYADRLGHLYVVWGSVVAAFFLNTAVAVVQVACGARGLFGFIEPGKKVWAPNWDDLLSGPGTSVLRVAGAARAGHPDWALPIADRPFLIGTQ
ncbi:MAG: O-antigen ligase domain-containing protein, partial [Planctomycetia bacterium]|nr:O-antigen ligase domain-containing protein [Planctomycetia bacterium]